MNYYLAVWFAVFQSRKRWKEMRVRGQNTRIRSSGLNGRKEIKIKQGQELVARNE